MSMIKKPKLLFILLLICLFYFLQRTLHQTPSQPISPQTLVCTESTETVTSTEIALLNPYETIVEEDLTTETTASDAQKETIHDESSTTTQSSNPEETTSFEGNSSEHVPIDDMSSSELALLEAGLGNVILLPTGDYGILMEHPDQMINGKRGNEILREYLARIGLEGTIYGCWMNEQYYNFFAENIQGQVSSDSKNFWD